MTKETTIVQASSSINYLNDNSKISTETSNICYTNIYRKNLKISLFYKTYTMCSNSILASSIVIHNTTSKKLDNIKINIGVPNSLKFLPDTLKVFFNSTESINKCNNLIFINHLYPNESIMFNFSAIIQAFNTYSYCDFLFNLKLTYNFLNQNSRSIAVTENYFMHK